MLASNWDKCQGLFFGQSPTGGRCPATGGEHNRQAASLAYFLVAENSARDFTGQNDWRWCRKCEGCFYGPHAPQSTCPAGGRRPVLLARVVVVHDPIARLDLHIPYTVRERSILGVLHGVAPLAAHPEVEGMGGGGKAGRPHPAVEGLGLRPGLEYEVARGVEATRDEELNRVAWIRDQRNRAT